MQVGTLAKFLDQSWSIRCVVDLPAKGVIEPSSGGAGFYFNVFDVPKHICGLRTILTLQRFNRYRAEPCT